MNKKWLIPGILVVVLAASATLFIREPEADVSEILISPETGAFEVSVTATGELKAKNSVNIFGPRGAMRAQIYNMKILRLIPEGTVVQKGMFVAELDKSELNSKIQTSQIDLQKAESQYTQTSLDTTMTLSQARDDLINLEYAMEEAELRKEQARYEPPSVRRQEEINFEKAQRGFSQAAKNYVTQQDQAVAKMQEVNAELSKARQTYNEFMQLAGEFTIMAPENGMLIYDRDWRGNKTATGGTVSAWNPVVATLPDLSIMESITYVNEVDIQKIAEGQPVLIGLDADADKQLSGVVTAVANIGEQRPNSDAKVFQVSIEIQESDSTLRPAMTTSNTIVVAELDSVLYIPLETIHAADSINFVYLKEGNAIVKQEVRLGLLNDNEAIVDAGLDESSSLYLSMPGNQEDKSIRFLEPVGDEALAEQQ